MRSPETPSPRPHGSNRSAASAACRTGPTVRGQFVTAVTPAQPTCARHCPTSAHPNLAARFSPLLDRGGAGLGGSAGLDPSPPRPGLGAQDDARPRGTVAETASGNVALLIRAIPTTPPTAAPPAAPPPVRDPPREEDSVDPPSWRAGQRRSPPSSPRPSSPRRAPTLRLASGEQRFDLDTFFVCAVATTGGASRHCALGARDPGA